MTNSMSIMASPLDAASSRWLRAMSAAFPRSMQCSRTARPQRGLGGATEIRQLRAGARHREVAGWIERYHQGALLVFALLVVAEIHVGEHEGGAAVRSEEHTSEL